MNFIRKIIQVIVYTGLLAIYVNSYAQKQVSIPSFFNNSLNRFQNDSLLNRIFEQLHSIEKEGKGRLSIVHIGDSHLQDGNLAGEVRSILQDRFGNAGRGIIFPYKLAKTDCPSDIICSSNVGWQYNRLLYPQRAVPTGIVGYGIQTSSLPASITMKLVNNDFDHLNFFFLRKDSLSLIVLNTLIANTSTYLTPECNDLAPASITFEKRINEFTLNFPCPDSIISPTVFLGVSAERNEPGIIYHSIGVNGARIDQYLNSNNFLEQVGYLGADLYIISLGTNESDNTSISQEKLQDYYTRFYSKIMDINPGAVLLITTPASSLRSNKYINTRIKDMRDAMISFANEEGLPYWDLFGLSGGNSARQWRSAGMLSRDGVHYTSQGYRLQGTLLANTFIQAYEDYCKTKP